MVTWYDSETLLFISDSFFLLEVQLKVEFSSESEQFE